MNKGVVYMIFSCLAFSIQNVIVKLLSYTMGTGEIAFFRGFISALMILGLMKAQHVHFSPYDHRALWFRGIMGGAGMICIFYALRGMPLADVSILANTSAFFVMLFSAIFLKEVLPKGAGVPLIFIFLGACLVVRPWDFASFNHYSLFVLAEAVFAAAAFTTISKLTSSGRHHQYEIVFYFLVCAALSGLLVMGLDYQAPTWHEWGLYILLGIITVLAQIWMTMAYAAANPVVVSFVAYISVFFNALWGYVIFDEVLTILTIAGGIGIIGGSMYLTKLKNDRIAQKASVTVRKAKN
ncbi:MAG: DMT family transporter [Megasphaera sp.]|nr:DMT family transporter [Megasphaera sp.]